MRFFIALFAILEIVLQISSEFVDPSLSRHEEQSYRTGRLTVLRKRAAATNVLRGRKHFNPEEDGFFDDFGYKKGQYYRQKDRTDFSDIRSNIPGEPGIDYAAYLDIPKTSFSCIGRSQGYYADEEAGCQVFHVCDDDEASSFLCPVGSLFSQRLLTCNWWTKVPCSESHRFYNLQTDFNKIPFEKKYVEPVNYEKPYSNSNHLPRRSRPSDKTLYNALTSFNYKQPIFHSLNRIEPTDKLPQRSQMSAVISTTLSTVISQDSPIHRIVTLPTNSQQYSSQSQENEQPTQAIVNTTTLPGEASTVREGKTYLKDVSTSSSYDMEGKESIGLINSHAERNLHRELDSSSETIVVVPEVEKPLQTTQYSTFSQQHSASTVEDSAVEQTASNPTEINDGVSMLPSATTTTRPAVIEATTFRYQGNLATAFQNYKTQNIHNLSGFKINAHDSQTAKSSNHRSASVESRMLNNRHSAATDDDDEAAHPNDQIASLQLQNPMANRRVSSLASIDNADSLNNQATALQSQVNSQQSDRSSSATENSNYNQHSSIDPASARPTVYHVTPATIQTPSTPTAHHIVRAMNILKASEQKHAKNPATATTATYQSRQPHQQFQTYTVNYHTHSFPDTLLQYHENHQSTTDSNQMTNAIANSQNRPKQQAAKYSHNDIVDENNDYFRNFGARIFNSENWPKSSANAHAINSQLQGNSASSMWTKRLNSEALPRAFSSQSAHRSTYPMDNISKTSLNIEAPSLNLDLLPVSEPTSNGSNQNPQQIVSKTSLQTEFIPSISFDFSNDQERTNYYENYHEERQTTVPSSFSQHHNAPEIKF